MSNDINRMEIAAYHEAGHCAVACVSGLEILDEGCYIQKLNDGQSFSGGAAIRMDGYYREEEMATAIAGATAAFIRDTQIVQCSGNLTEEARLAIYERTAEGMLAVDVSGENRVSADVEFMVCFLPALTDTWYRGSPDDKAILALAAAGAVAVHDRTRINARLKEFRAAADPVSDAWYVTVEDAAKNARAILDDRADIVGALARHLLKEMRMSGPDVKKFLHDRGCRCAPVKRLASPGMWEQFNPLRGRNPS